MMDSRQVRMVSYSDNAEDVLLVRAFHDRPPGFFVDVGAGSPVAGSVVYNLRQILGWRGLHVEPAPELAKELQAEYRGDVIVRAAIGKAPGELPFYWLPGTGGLSTLDADIATRHHASGLASTPIMVPVRVLHDVLGEARVPRRFELLKVDVEGWEDQVLAGARLDFWQPSVIVVESTEPGSPRRVDRGVSELLGGSGYCHTLFDGLNSFFVRADEETLRTRLSVPANVFDRYVRHDWFSRMAQRHRPAIHFEPWGDLCRRT